MGTLRTVKRKMKFDKDWRKTLIRSAKDEILIDLDGDGQPDLALMDSVGDGDIDTLAVDLTGDGEFDLYFHDSDSNGLPDMVFLDSDGDGCIDLVGVGPEVEEKMLLAGQTILGMMHIGDYIAEALDKALDELEAEIKIARKQLKLR